MNGVRQELDLRSPWLNAAGFQGFAPQGEWNWAAPQGVFVTNPISWNSRAPAEHPLLRQYAGGFLLHTGFPNPGFRRGVQQNARRWAGAALPVWVHLLAERPHELNSMVRTLESMEGVAAIEISLPPGLDDNEAIFLVKSALGELPLVLALPVDAVSAGWVAQLAGLGVSALCLSAPRGKLPGADNRWVSGRLFGPGLLPQALAALSALRRLNLPIIAGCGIFTQEGGQAALDGGAAAVQIDAALWRD